MDDFSYEPMSELQAQQERYSLLKEGIYDASVEKFEGKLSSTGNRMIVFDLNVYDHNGATHLLKDFIAFTPKMTWKLRHHCVSAGLEKEFEDKTWRPQMSIGKLVRVKVIVQSGQEIPHDKLRGKAPGECYPDRNSIGDYVANNDIKSISSAKPHNDSGFDDEIPF